MCLILTTLGPQLINVILSFEDKLESVLSGAGVFSAESLRASASRMSISVEIYRDKRPMELFYHVKR